MSRRNHNGSSVAPRGDLVPKEVVLRVTEIDEPGLEEIDPQACMT